MNIIQKISVSIIVIFAVFFISIGLVFGQLGISEVEAQKAKLEAELIELEKEIAEKQVILDSQEQKSATLERDVSILKTEISKSKLKIKERDIIIEKLKGEINQRSKTITKLSTKIEREKESLGQLIRKTREIDTASSLVHIVLSTESLSDFYTDLDSFATIKESIKESVDEIKGVKIITEKEKIILQEEKDAETDARVEIENQKRSVEKKEQEKKELLIASQNKEKEYKQILAERETRAAQIRSALFGLRDTVAIPFGQALEYANFASEKTGVRPALILAILKQESNLGQNSNADSCSVKFKNKIILISFLSF